VAYGGLAFLLDFAIIYALSGFMGTIFIALFLSDRKLGKRRAKSRGGNLPPAPKGD
jgi:multisubunit Na+/H+ antiporter MnhF subunit